MLEANEQQFLQKAGQLKEQQFQYYLVMAILLVLLSWGLYFSLIRTGTLLIASLISVGVWYYPWRYYQQKKAIQQDLKNQEKIVLQTTVYSTYTSKINRLKPYYFVSTDDENFEVEKVIYNSLKQGDRIQVIYTPLSKTILEIRLIQ